MVAKPLCPLYKNIIKPLDRARYPELRYYLSYNMSDWIHETNDDIKPLEKLKGKVDEIIKTEKYIRKAAFMNLSKSLDGAIKRCKGDLHAKPF